MGVLQTKKGMIKAPKLFSDENFTMPWCHQIQFLRPQPPQAHRSLPFQLPPQHILNRFKKPFKPKIRYTIHATPLGNTQRPHLGYDLFLFQTQTEGQQAMLLQVILCRVCCIFALLRQLRESPKPEALDLAKVRVIKDPGYYDSPTWNVKVDFWKGPFIINWVTGILTRESSCLMLSTYFQYARQMGEMDWNGTTSPIREMNTTRNNLIENTSSNLLPIYIWVKYIEVQYTYFMSQIGKASNHKPCWNTVIPFAIHFWPWPSTASGSAAVVVELGAILSKEPGTIGFSRVSCGFRARVIS